jgi:hypothetical protein
MENASVLSFHKGNLSSPCFFQGEIATNRNKTIQDRLQLMRSIDAISHQLNWR